MIFQTRVRRSSALCYKPGKGKSILRCWPSVARKWLRSPRNGKTRVDAERYAFIGPYALNSRAMPRGPEVPYACRRLGGRTRRSPENGGPWIVSARLVATLRARSSLFALAGALMPMSQ
jgi:hypothetical protein